MSDPLPCQCPKCLADRLAGVDRLLARSKVEMGRMALAVIQRELLAFVAEQPPPAPPPPPVRPGRRASAKKPPSPRARARWLAGLIEADPEVVPRAARILDLHPHEIRSAASGRLPLPEAYWTRLEAELG